MNATVEVLTGRHGERTFVVRLADVLTDADSQSLDEASRGADVIVLQRPSALREQRCWFMPAA